MRYRFFVCQDENLKLASLARAPVCICWPEHRNCNPEVDGSILGLGVIDSNGHLSLDQMRVEIGVKTKQTAKPQNIWFQHSGKKS